MSKALAKTTIPKAELYTRLAHNANLISGSSGMIINAVQSVFIVFFCLIFIAMLSRLAFIMVVFAIGFGFSNYIARQAIIAEERNVARSYESRFFDMIHQILDGFKELKVNRQKSDAHFSVFMSLAKATKRLKITTGFRFITGLMYSQTFFYILLALIVFLMPRLEFIDNALIVRITVAVLFLAGPISIITGAYPMYSMANMAATHLYELEEQLDTAATVGHEQQHLPSNPFSPFDHLTFHDVAFSYNNDKGESLFSVGPLDLTVKQGEILFLVGGNGSGKTTLIKLLAGLYYPADGESVRTH